MAAAPTFVGTPKITSVKIVNADASTAKTVVTAGASGTKIVSLVATSDDTSARVIQVSLVRSATSYLIGAVNVPTLSGTDGATQSVDLLNITGLPQDADGQHYIFLESGDTLTVTSTSTVTSAKTVTATAVHGSF